MGGIIKVQVGIPADALMKGMIPPQAQIVKDTLVDTRSVKGMVPQGNDEKRIMQRKSQYFVRRVLNSDKIDLMI